MKSVNYSTFRCRLSNPMVASLYSALVIAASSTPIRADDYIVVLKRDAAPEAVAKTHGLARKHTFTHALNGFAGHVPEGRLHALRNDPRVEFIEPDLEVFALAQTTPTGLRRIGADLSSAAKIDGLDERVELVPQAIPLAVVYEDSTNGWMWTLQSLTPGSISPTRT